MCGIVQRRILFHAVDYLQNNVIMIGHILARTNIHSEQKERALNTPRVTFDTERRLRTASRATNHLPGRYYTAPSIGRIDRTRMPANGISTRYRWRHQPTQRVLYCRPIRTSWTCTLLFTRYTVARTPFKVVFGVSLYFRNVQPKQVFCWFFSRQTDPDDFYATGSTA